MANSCKYYKQRREMSYDGVTWIPLDEYRKGDLVPGASSDCSEPTPSLYRWVQTDNTICVNSFTGKFRAKYANGQTYEIPCTPGDTVLSLSEVRGGNYPYSSITDVEIGSCVSSLWGQIFLGCSSLSSATIGDVQYLSNAFYGCSNLKSISIPLDTISIGPNCFRDCSGLTSIYIPNSVTDLRNGAFMNCYGLKYVTIGNGVEDIEAETFAGCTGMTAIKIGSSVSSIGNSAFYECMSLDEISIPDNVISIGDMTFGNCDGLYFVSIGSGCTSIGNQAFAWCDMLQMVGIYATTPPTLGGDGDIFTGCSNLRTIYVPAGSKSAYQSAWSLYADKFEEMS